jgi:hypothetical protein
VKFKLHLIKLPLLPFTLFFLRHVLSLKENTSWLYTWV